MPKLRPVGAPVTRAPITTDPLIVAAVADLRDASLWTRQATRSLVLDPKVRRARWRALRFLRTAVLQLRAAEAVILRAGRTRP